MKKNKLITMGVCAAVLANIATTPLVALAETMTPISSEPVTEETTPSSTEPTETKPSEEVSQVPDTSIKPEAPAITVEPTEQTTDTKPAETPTIKPGVRPIKPEVKPVVPEATPETPTDTTLTQAKKDDFMAKSFLEFQGISYSYADFLRFTDSLNKENYTVATWEAMVAARLAFRTALGQASTEAELANVEIAAANFVKAVDGLRSHTKSSSKKLEASIKAVNWASLIRDDYTSESWNNLASIYKAAINTFEASKTSNIYQEELDNLADALAAATKALRKKVVATKTVNVNVNLEGKNSFVNAPYNVTQEIGDGITLQIWDMPAQSSDKYNYVIYVDGVIAVNGISTFGSSVLITANEINTGQDASNGYGNDLREVKTNLNLMVANSRTPNDLDKTHTFNFNRYDYDIETSQIFVIDGGTPGREGYSYVEVAYTEFGVILNYYENGVIVDVMTVVEAKDSSYTFNYMENGSLGRLTINLNFLPGIGITDKTNLEKMLHFITLAIDRDLFTQTSLNVLDIAINNARDVLNNPTASLPEVNNAYDKLQNAIDSLDLINPVEVAGKLDTAALVTQINIARSKQENHYTATSWTSMISSLEVAETVLRYSDFKNIDNGHTARAAQVNVNVTQPMVATATANLKTALAKLELVKNEKPELPIREIVYRETPQPPVEKTKIVYKKIRGRRLTQTNVSLGAMPALGGLSAAMGSIVAFLKGRKNK